MARDHGDQLKKSRKVSGSSCSCIVHQYAVKKPPDLNQAVILHQIVVVKGDLSGHIAEQVAQVMVDRY